MARCRLQDRFRVTTWARFLFFFSLFFVPAFLGLGDAGQVPLRTAWVFFLAAFFGLGLPAILCRHCPHYARRGWFIVCPTTVGPPKLFRPSPRPVSPPEKAAFGIGFALVLAFPVVILAVKGRLGLAAVTLAGAGLFFLGEQIFNCSRCLNFSCLLNRVPREIRDEWTARPTC
jgi:hypothetical protein